MIRKEDLEILSHLLDDLKKPSNNLGLTVNDLPEWYEDKLSLTDNIEEINNEIKRLISIFSSNGIGTYYNNKGFHTLMPTLQTFSADFNKLYEQQIEENRKRDVDLEVQHTNIELNKWLLKTRWLPHIVAGTSIIISIYSFFYNQSKFETEVNELEDRIEMLEKMNLLEENI